MKERKARTGGRSALTEQQVQRIRSLWDAGGERKFMARYFKLPYLQLYRIGNRLTYKDVPERGKK